MKVAIIGYGFVGKAVYSAIREDVDIVKIDPALGTDLNDLLNFKPDFIFVCLPTPMQSNGSQDLSILKNVFNQLKENKLSGNIILKSTVTPENLLALNSKIDFVYNPEFLREKTAESDFINAKLILFGGSEQLCKEASRFYLKYTKCKQKEHQLTDQLTASLVKYSINSFLATKVIFFNQLKSLCQATGEDLDWENLIKITSIDERIGDSHMNVPGHDGRNGFGGACFPKDIAALDSFSSKLDFDFSLIREVIKINNQIRSVYNEPIKREVDQNISFNDEE
tara:strand:+ start:56 stop:898 length:843 start_codon:yes stop_codon:yes gene_type:complete